MKYFLPIVVFLLTTHIFQPTAIFAQGPGPARDTATIFRSQYNFLANFRPSQYVSTGINLLLGIAGVAAFLYLLWGGIEWVTSGSDKEALDRARKRILHAMVGLAVTFSAYALVLIIQILFGIPVFRIPLISIGGNMPPMPTYAPPPTRVPPSVTPVPTIPTGPTSTPYPTVPPNVSCTQACVSAGYLGGICNSSSISPSLGQITSCYNLNPLLPICNCYTTPISPTPTPNPNAPTCTISGPVYVDPNNVSTYTTSCSDPNNNLTTCRIDYTPASGGFWTFTPNCPINPGGGSSSCSRSTYPSTNVEIDNDGQVCCFVYDSTGLGGFGSCQNVYTVLTAGAACNQACQTAGGTQAVCNNHAPTSTWQHIASGDSGCASWGDPQWQCYCNFPTPQYVSTTGYGPTTGFTCDQYCTTHGFSSCSGSCTSTPDCSSTPSTSWEVSYPSVWCDRGANYECDRMHSGVYVDAFGRSYNSWCCCR